MSDPAKAYCDCMEDVKVRLKLIRSITEGHSPLGSEGLNGEVVCLLLRRVLEQIVFGSLVAHREAYEAVHKDVETVWRAKRLLERLGQVHPDYYPKPVKRSPWQPNAVINFVDVKRGYLTKEDFVFLYDTASNGIHTWNPFKNAERVLNFRISIAEWVKRIETLLQLHYIKFAGSPDVWLVQMDNSEDHRVHTYTAPAVDPEAIPPTAAMPTAIKVSQTENRIVTIRFHPL